MGSDVFLCALGRKLDDSRPLTHEEVALWRRLHPFPLEEHRFRAPLAADDADRLAADDLRLRIDTCSGTVAQPIPHDLRQVAHELVVALQTVCLDADDRAIVG